ncbi:MAG: LLM class flavin-dependent oxidoreductase [Vicinamibacterales bacterium]
MPTRAAPPRVGLGISTCREGLAYPCGFADLPTTVAIAQQAEQLGFDALWGNDHLATQRVVMDTQPEPPSFYEPLITFSYLAGIVPRVRLVVATVVAPLREPVLLAKQAATLDRASGGRFVLGLGIGAYREEFEAIGHQRPKANRGRMMDESIAALRALFGQRRAAFEGQYWRFAEIEVYPKPVQDPFPIYLTGSATDQLQRVATAADGWITASTPVDRTNAMITQLRRLAAEAGRDPAGIETCAQLWVGIGETSESALDVLSRSQHFRRMQAQDPTAGVDATVAKFASGNLLGTPEQIRSRMADYRAAGVDHFALIFLAESAEELAERVDLFGRTVLIAIK